MLSPNHMSGSAIYLTKYYLLLNGLSDVTLTHCRGEREGIRQKQTNTGHREGLSMGRSPINDWFPQSVNSCLIQSARKCKLGERLGSRGGGRKVHPHTPHTTIAVLCVSRLTGESFGSRRRPFGRWKARGLSSATRPQGSTD